MARALFPLTLTWLAPWVARFCACRSSPVPSVAGCFGWGSLALALALWTGNWSRSTFISPENGGLVNSCTHLTPVHEIFGFSILNFITFHHDTQQGLLFHIIRVVALGCHLGSPVVLVCPGLREFLGQWPFQCWNCESPGQIGMSWSLLSSQAPVGFIATVLVDFWG